MPHHSCKARSLTWTSPPHGAWLPHGRATLATLGAAVSSDKSRPCGHHREATHVLSPSVPTLATPTRLPTDQFSSFAKDSGAPGLDIGVVLLTSLLWCWSSPGVPTVPPPMGDHHVPSPAGGHRAASSLWTSWTKPPCPVRAQDLCGRGCGEESNHALLCEGSLPSALPVQDPLSPGHPQSTCPSTARHSFLSGTQVPGIQLQGPSL